MSTPGLSVEAIWRRYDRDEQRLTAAVSERMLDLAGVGAGQRVLDLGTGRGEPAVRAAHRVGARGQVVGVDSDAAMLAMAAERAAEEGVRLDLRVGDITGLAELGRFDAVLARWCLMYVREPVAVLAAARRALGHEGRLVVAVWAEPERVDYMGLPRSVLARFVSLPEVGEGPGTFAYADVGRIKRDFAAAGLRVEGIEEMYTPVMQADSVPEAIAWTRLFGMNRLLSGLPEATVAAWERAMAEALSGQRGPGVSLGGITRLVVGRP